MSEKGKVKTHDGVDTLIGLVKGGVIVLRNLILEIMLETKNSKLLRRIRFSLNKLTILLKSWRLLQRRSVLKFHL